MVPMRHTYLFALFALLLGSCSSMGWNSWSSSETVWVVEATGGA